MSKKYDGLKVRPDNGVWQGTLAIAPLEEPADYVLTYAFYDGGPSHQSLWTEEQLDSRFSGKFAWSVVEQSPPAVSRKLYLIGSLRNPKVQELAAAFRKALPGWEVFDDWQAAGPEADDYWRDYEKGKGHDFAKALEGYAAKHVYEFDKHHLDTSDAAILILPAGKSGHLELGYMVGKGKYTAIMLDDDPERFDVMYQFVDKVTRNVADIVEDLDGR